MAEAFIGNSRALALWERLVLKGQRIAAVTGKDLMFVVAVVKVVWKLTVRLPV